VTARILHISDLQLGRREPPEPISAPARLTVVPYLWNGGEFDEVGRRSFARG